METSKGLTYPVRNHDCMPIGPLIILINVRQKFPKIQRFVSGLILAISEVWYIWHIDFLELPTAIPVLNFGAKITPNLEIQL